MGKIRFVIAALGACWVMTAGAASNDYPSKPVRFISPFSAGGGTDTVARALALRLGDALGKTFIVDNRAGAEGIIGTELGAKSPPDGYTLLVGNLGTLAINPNLRKVPYDPLRDFAPIIQTTASSTVLVVHPSLPVKNVRELVALAKSKPLNYGASSSGTFLPMELFKQMAKIDMTHVPYKGTGPTLTGILSGEVQVMFGGAINTVPLVKGGKLRALAVAGDRRAKALPDVPTVAEAGYPGYEANTWNGMLAPAGTPRAIVQRLNQEMMKILGTREVIEYMTADGAEPAGNTPEHFAAYIRSEHAKWAKVIKDARISQSN
jgi:tripartite-type tricarboxylate transporter receptor subunit TctC